MLILNVICPTVQPSVFTRAAARRDQCLVTFAEADTLWSPIPRPYGTPSVTKITPFQGSTSKLPGRLEGPRDDSIRSGQPAISGRLRALGYYVTRSRLRQVIQNTDPINWALRWGTNLHVRRPYSVPGPNSLWHIGMYSLFRSLCILPCKKWPGNAANYDLRL